VYSSVAVDRCFLRGLGIPARCRTGSRSLMSFSALVRDLPKSRMVCCCGTDAPSRSHGVTGAKRPVAEHEPQAVVTRSWRNWPWPLRARSTAPGSGCAGRRDDPTAPAWPLFVVLHPDPNRP
jgi:hypothetical protein